jgi:hypothetical protein
LEAFPLVGPIKINLIPLSFSPPDNWLSLPMETGTDCLRRVDIETQSARFVNKSKFSPYLVLYSADLI